MLKALISLIPLCAVTLASAFAADSQAAKEERFLKHPRQVLFAGQRSGGAQVGDRGRYMVFEAEREKENPFFQVYIQDRKSGEVHLISPGTGKAQGPDLHPEKRRVLLASTHLDKEARAKQKKEQEARESGQSRHAYGDFDENFDLFTLDFRGRQLRRLTKERGYDAEASFSPDGQWIVFASNREAYSSQLTAEEQAQLEKNPAHFVDLYLMKVDGQEVKRLTTEPGYDGQPVFSPDGQKIVWQRALKGGHQYEIFIMDRDGGGKKALTQTGKIAWTPTFHPSGDYLLYSAMTEGHNFELFFLGLKGSSEPIQVTHHKAFDSTPSFTPDGETLIWTSSRNSDKGSDIFMADWKSQVVRSTLGLSSSQPFVKSFDPEIRASEIQQIVQYLASPKLQGRLTGSPGQKAATDFAAEYFAHIGLKPAGDKKSFFDSFEFSAAVELGDLNELQIANKEKEWKKSFQVRKDWIPLVFSGTGALKGSGIVFAGYGIEAPAGQGFEAFNSYQDLDVKDKWVMVYRYMPEDLPSDQRQYLARYSKLNTKAMVARDRGAQGLIVVSGPQSKVKKDLVPLDRHNVSGAMSLPVISITDRVAHEILSQLGHNISKYQETLDQGEQETLTFDGFQVTGFVDLKRQKKTARNVIARLQAGRNPSSRVVVIGAHLDHLGRGETGNSLARSEEKGQVHPGADDNASGVAAVMELAHDLNELKNTAQWKGRSDVIFALWSGEELGTLGSSHFVSERLQQDGPKVLAYFNLDMVGRYQDSLNLQALGSSPGWEKEIEKAQTRLKLNLVTQKDPYLPTDSTPFYLRKIPVLSAFTGVHGEYHSPRDIPETLNYEAIKGTAELVATLAYSVADRSKPLEYVSVPRKTKATPRHRMRVYLGTIPDYSKTDLKGVALMGVQEGGAASKAGLQRGDVIVELSGRKIENIHDYTNALGFLKVGEKTSIAVEREGQKVNLDLVPESRD